MQSRIFYQDLWKGRMEGRAIRLAGVTGEVIPDVRRKAVLVMCGDHGVTKRG
jgi:nicotinate-nucleotide--dimethylbenzimidazole phosphoribosyltransferase